MPRKAQGYYNHHRTEPIYHYLLLPLSLAYLALAVYFFYQDGVVVKNWPRAGFNLMPGLILPLTVIVLRLNNLRLQDRTIRLELRQRYFTLSGQTFNGMEAKLNISQMRALRFASDAEFLPLAERAAEEKLSSREIKKKIRQWKGDYSQV
jgi:hypothetical protein